MLCRIRTRLLAKALLKIALLRPGETIADAIAGKGLSRTYDSIEEMVDDLAEHALHQYEQGNCVEIREFARKEQDQSQQMNNETFTVISNRKISSAKKA